MNKVKIVEALCGCGKTHWMIEQMRQMFKSDPTQSFMFISPYLDEAGDMDDPKPKEGRCRENAPEMDFQIPSSKDGTKMEHLQKLLFEGANISMTHALFMKIGYEQVELIERQGYIIVIDEVIEKVELHEKSKEFTQDIKSLISSDIIKVCDNGKLEWVGIKLNAFQEEHELCEQGVLYLHNDKLLIKRYSSLVYERAKQVYVLTYLFEGSPMRVWFNINGIEYEYVEADLYRSNEDRKAAILPLIYIEPDDRDIMSVVKATKHTTFTSSWYKRYMSHDNPRYLSTIKKVGERLYLRWYKQNGNKPPSIMYTCFKDYRDKMATKGTKRGDATEVERREHFVSKSARATNQHADRNHLIYWVSVYPHVSIITYLNSFVEPEQELDQEMYALSEMIQWVFRSAIRNDEPIKLFIASPRMKKLFTDWLHGK